MNAFRGEVLHRYSPAYQAVGRAASHRGLQINAFRGEVLHSYSPTYQAVGRAASHRGLKIMPSEERSLSAHQLL